MDAIIVLTTTNAILAVLLMVVIIMKRPSLPLSDADKRELEWKTELHAFEHVKFLLETDPKSLPKFLDDMIYACRYNLGRGIFQTLGIKFGEPTKNENVYIKDCISIPKDDNAVKQTVSYLESRGFKVKSKDKAFFRSY